MTIYEKPRSEVFASKAPESEISTFTAWLRGLGIAFDETNGLPEMKGLNNVFNLLNQYIKYLEQNGFAEWSPDLEYPIGAGVRVGVVWYRAKTQNTNKPPATSQNDWELFLNASALTYENPLYIENNVVKVCGATQTQSGVVQFANDIEISQKANVSKTVNPANVVQMFESSLNSEILPSGREFKWGKTQNIGDEQTISVVFDQPFRNGVFVIQLTENRRTTGSSNASHVAVLNPTKNGFQIYHNSTQPVSTSCDWLAIGY